MAGLVQVGASIVVNSIQGEALCSADRCPKSMDLGGALEQSAERTDELSHGDPYGLLDNAKHSYKLYFDMILVKN